MATVNKLVRDKGVRFMRVFGTAPSLATLDFMNKSRVINGALSSSRKLVLPKYPYTSYRVLAFVTASFFAGFVGSFMAHYHHYTCPDDFHVMESLFIQIYTFIGGLGSLAGAIVGPLAIMSISEVFRVAKEAQPLLYAGIMLLVIMWLPGGLITIPSLLKKWRRKGHESSKQISS